nr:vesicle-associated protein 1-2-like [Ipomoea trifida]
MSAEELLIIDPLELRFPFELRKSISCSFELLNKTDSHAAFKVKTTNPRKYTVRPNSGVVPPRSRCNVTVTMQPQSEAPLDMQCKDKFLIQCVSTHPGVTPKDISQETFNKEVGKNVQECKLKVVYVSPPRPPSPVPEEPEEVHSPRASRTEMVNQDENSAPRDQIVKLMEERDAIIQQNGKLRRELEYLRRGGSQKHAGVPLLYVLLIGLIGILMGYLFRKS